MEANMEQLHKSHLHTHTHTQICIHEHELAAAVCGWVGVCLLASSLQRTFNLSLNEWSHGHALTPMVPVVPPVSERMLALTRSATLLRFCCSSCQGSTDESYNLEADWTREGETRKSEGSEGVCP